MNLNEEVELLKGVPIFSKVEPAKLKLLAFTSERVNFTAGQVMSKTSNWTHPKIDELLKAKLVGSGLEPYVEVFAHIDTEAEKRLVPLYRLEI